MKTNLIFALLIATLSSCTSYVSVQKTLPPEIIIPDNEGDFLFVNRFVYTDLDYNNENKKEVFSMGQKSFVEGLKAGFDTSQYYHLTLGDTIIKAHSAHEPAANLSPTDVLTLCEQFNQEYLLTLDNYDLFFFQDVEVVEDEDGSKSRTAYYDLVVNTYVTIYSKDGLIIDKIKDELRIFHDKRGVISGLLAVGPSMGKADKNAILISDELGRKFIQKFYPMNIMEERLFYTSKEFSRAYNNYLMQNWVSVESDLQQIAENPDKKTSGRAAYNLAVFYENRNKPDLMKYWYNIAKQKLGSDIPRLPIPE